MASRMRRLIYPENWQELARAAKEKADWKCGIAQGTECIGLKGKIMLTVHHPNGDTENPDAVLVALCQTCPLKDLCMRSTRRKHAAARGDASRTSAIV